MPGLVKRRASGMIIGNALRDFRRAVESGEAVEATDEKADEVTDEEPTPTHDDDAAPLARAPASTPHPDAVAYEDAGTEPRPLPPPSILESVLTELLGAVPEVKDHVLEAADALLDAAKALIDAADRVVRQQRGDD
jgi:hypothetical protein